MFHIGPFSYSFKKNVQSDSLVRKIYSDDQILILDKELVVMTGPSGAGKSTLLQLLKGIIPEYSAGDLIGEITYQSNPVAGSYFKKNLKRILFLFQNPYSQLIYPQVEEEFFFSMENFNFTRQEMDQKKEELKELFDLDCLMDKNSKELSNGECQRLVLASLMGTDPEVLLLDEPTAFLDPKARLRFYKWIKSIKGTKTIVIVDHHLDEIIPFADKIIHISGEGRVTTGMPLPPSISENTSLKNFSISQQNEIELAINNLSFHYSQHKPLFRDISLKILSGEVVVIKGENGKGKSTLFKIVAGLLRPVHGKIQIKNSRGVLPVKKHLKEIGFIFQNPESHFFYDTILEEFKHVSKSEDIQSLLKLFLRDVDCSRSPFLLSEGEKRRLSILITILQNKNILLYDEPTFGQDEISKNLIVDIIMNLKKAGKIQLIISHDEAFIKSIGAFSYSLENEQLVRVKE